jgi:GT2 family glycosyltransferase
MINWKPVKNFLRQNRATSFAYQKLVRLYYTTRRRFPRSYSSWIMLSESLAKYAIQKTHNTILVVIDADGKSDEELLSLINSVTAQHYPFWQIFIYSATPYSNTKTWKNLLIDDGRITCYQKNDPTFANQVLPADTNNNCWVMILSGNFLLSPHCLTEFNLRINHGPNNSALIYSDHDELSHIQKRKNPNFKPDWNPDLFYSQDYIENCCIYSARVIAELGLSQTAFSRDFFYNLTLRIAKVDDDSVIQHIPKVLFHKIKPLAKLDASLAQLTLQNTLQNELITVLNNEKHGLLVSWPIPKKEPLVSLIIPTRNGHDILKQAINSIVEKTSYQNYEIIIVDNQSDCQKTLDYLSYLTKRHKTVRVVPYDLPFNYSAINNFAVDHANGEILGFINNDVEVISKNWLTEMVSHALRANIGCVGAKLYYANNTLQHAGVIVGMHGCAGHSHKFYKRASLGYFERLIHVQNYSAVTAACLLIRKEVFKQVAGFDEQNLTIAFNDIDLCLKVKNLNLHNLWTPHAELYHHESISRGVDTKPEQIERANKEIEYMHNAWNTQNFNDPAYNINLSVACEDFSITRRNEL